MEKRILAALLGLCVMAAALSACTGGQETVETPEDAVMEELGMDPEEQEDSEEPGETEAPPEEGIRRVPEDAQPLKPYDEVYLNYADSDSIDEPYLVGKQLFDPDDLYTYRYESNIVFEGAQELAEQLMEKGKDPGLGVRGLHAQGITGEGVKVAIIDQNLLPDHPEYADCIAAYYDSGCGIEGSGSMHGPAVLSILAGKTLGVAPGAEVYFAAAPSWKLDAAYYADCLNWIVEQNEALPEGEKIRVVSVSASPERWSGGGGYTNGDQWVEAVAAAEEAGILVIDVRGKAKTGFVGLSYCMEGPSDNVQKYRPGTPLTTVPNREDMVFAPACFRTTAQEYSEGNYIYTYWGEGGVSWSVPYVAGVLALGWQINPELDADTMKELLLESAWVDGRGCHMIDPPAFIELVQATVK